MAARIAAVAMPRRLRRQKLPPTSSTGMTHPPLFARSLQAAGPEGEREARLLVRQGGAGDARMHRQLDHPESLSWATKKMIISQAFRMPATSSRAAPIATASKLGT